MLRDVPLLPLPDSPSAVVTNNEILRALIAPPSTVSPVLLQCAGMRNLFPDDAKTSDTNKRVGELPSTGYSPTKKKGGRLAWGFASGSLMRREGISLCNSLNTCKDNLLDASSGYLDDSSDVNYYSPTPTYKMLIQTARKQKTHELKVILDSCYYAFLGPLTFDTKQFPWGHSQVYSKEEMRWFDMDFQKQLTFNFCATRATKKKAATINEAQASCLRDVYLDVLPASFHSWQQIIMSCLAMYLRMFWDVLLVVDYLFASKPMRMPMPIQQKSPTAIRQDALLEPEKSLTSTQSVGEWPATNSLLCKGG